MSSKDITVDINQNPDTGMYVGQVVNVPGIICQGKTFDQVSQRILAAYDKYVSYLAQKQTIVPKNF